MAIAFARMEFGKPGWYHGYPMAEKVKDTRTGAVHDFSRHAPPVHHAVLLPEGAPPAFGDAHRLWQAAEAAEQNRLKRRGGRPESVDRLMHELLLALPANPQVTHANRVALAASFAQKHLVSQGLAVQLDIHAPDDGDPKSPAANWHAHLLMTTRCLGGHAKDLQPDGFDRTKATHLFPKVRWIQGRPCLVEGPDWTALWRQHQNWHFQAWGYDIEVDPDGLIPEVHVGPVRSWPAKPGKVALLRACQAANREATYDAASVLDKLTRNSATFTARELDRLLAKQLGGAADEIAAVRALVLASPELVVLHDRATGEAAGRFTTRQVRAEEEAVLAAASALSAQRTGAASPAGVPADRRLRPDQQAAFAHAVAAGQLKLIAGRAGTGKSRTLAAIRAACEADGQRVTGLAPTHAVANDLTAGGFAQALTVHSALFQLKNGKMRWGPDSVVIADEAAMLSTPILKELLVAAGQAGAKLILAGDDRQLASVERGGMFAELLQRHGTVELTKVERQQGWQRQAAQDLADYRFDAALAAFEAAGAIHWRDTKAAALDALVAAWGEDRAAWRAAHPGGADERCFVFASTNAEVDALNARLRAVCRAQGDLKGPDVFLAVCDQAPAPGEPEVLHRAAFAVGDRIQFTRTDQAAGLVSGEVATITHLDATGEIRARLDADGPGREVAWNAQAFNGLRHGYAGTIHKGKTLERTYLLHSRHWTAAPAYVALTRHRTAAAIFVSRATAADTEQLARQMARQEARAASLAWAAAGAAGGGGHEPRLADAALGGVSARELEAGKARVRRKYAQRQAQQKAGEGVPAPLAPASLADGAAPVPAPATTGGDAGQALGAPRARKQRAAERLQARGLVRDWRRRLAAFHRALAARGREHPDYAQARDRLRAFAQALHAQPEQAVLLHTSAPARSPGHQPLLRRLLDSPDPERTIAQYIADAERMTQRPPPAPPPHGKPRRTQQYRDRNRSR